ncbi:MAG: NADH-quinone oxidoreductase subunit NuoH [Chloroflexota bacterium]
MDAETTAVALTAGRIALQTLAVGGIIVFVVITGFAYGTLLERKLLARMQVRVGPNRAGYIPIPRRGKPERRLLGGVLQPLADAVKLFMKEDLTPDHVDPVVYNLAPMLTVAPAVFSLAVIPWAPRIPWLHGRPEQIVNGEVIPAIEPLAPYLAQFDYLAIAPGLNVALLFILAITSVEVYGVVLAGWASNSKYAVLGGIRSTAQMISYELSLGLTLLIPVMIAGSLNMNDIVQSQINNGWFIFLQPIAGIIFYIGALAELQRAPFDLLEAEQELSSGYNVEYAGMRFAMFMMAEYMKMIIFSALWAVLFLGGYHGPFLDTFPLLGPVYLILKIVFGLFIMIWIRASWPRLRYDQLMDLGWKTLLPISVLNVLITGIFIVLAEEGVFDPLLALVGFGG